MLQYISIAERQAASFLHFISLKLSELATKLETAPLTAQCDAKLSQLSIPLPTTPFSNLHSISEIKHSFSSPLFIIPIALASSLVLVLLFPFIGRLIFGTDPLLTLIPPPSHLYDPQTDEQADLFGDDDVRPQLSRTGQPCINPATDEILGRIHYHTVNDVTQAVQRARNAQPIWSTSSFSDRKAVLRVLRQYMLYEHRSIADISCSDTGKTPLDAALGEILPTLEKIRWLIEEGEQALLPDKRSTGPVTMHKKASVEFLPLGVIAAIAPWNYPVHNFFNPVLAALFSGNAIVVKPSEYSIYSSLYCVRIIRRILALCGHNPELVQLVVGGAQVGQSLINADIDKLFFTGSTKVGKIVAQTAAEKLLPTCLELGGKDPFIIADDVNVDRVVDICMRGVFQNSGQNCIGVERVFVHEKIVDDFVAKALKKVKMMRLGVDLGAMTMGNDIIQNIQDLVDDAVSKGAKLLAGGQATKIEGKGSYYEPTILKGISKDMRIVNEEVFGPVMSIITWDDEDKMLEMVNESPFGLGSSLFCKNKSRAERIFGGIRAGMGNINDFATNYLCQSMPFGGTKESGSDKFAGIEGLRGCCLQKSTTRDKYTGISTSIPKNLKYPTSNNAYEYAAEINNLFYSTGWLSKIDSARNLIGMTMFPSWCPRSTASG